MKDLRRYKPTFGRKILYYEREGNEYTGRTICVLWHGDMRYIGVADFGTPPGIHRRYDKRPDQTLKLKFQGRNFKISLAAPAEKAYSKRIGRSVAEGRALYVAAVVQTLTTRRRETDGRHEFFRSISVRDDWSLNSWCEDIPRWMLVKAPRKVSSEAPQAEVPI